MNISFINFTTPGFCTDCENILDSISPRVITWLTLASLAVCSFFLSTISAIVYICPLSTLSRDAINSVQNFSIVKTFKIVRASGSDEDKSDTIIAVLASWRFALRKASLSVAIPETYLTYSLSKLYFSIGLKSMLLVKITIGYLAF